MPPASRILSRPRARHDPSRSASSDGGRAVVPLLLIRTVHRPKADRNAARESRVSRMRPSRTTRCRSPRRHHDRIPYRGDRSLVVQTDDGRLTCVSSHSANAVPKGSLICRTKQDRKPKRRRQALPRLPRSRPARLSMRRSRRGRRSVPSAPSRNAAKSERAKSERRQVGRIAASRPARGVAAQAHAGG